jgi:hypothetical protein
VATLNDPVFGELSNYEHGWSRRYTISIFGESKDVDIHIEADTEPTQRQQDVLLRFERNKEKCIGDIENCIYEYYSSILQDRRADFEDAADELMPVVSNVSRLGALVSLGVILISDRNPPGDKQIGFLFDCTWDPDHGIAVELTDNEVTAVGSQDIVL